MTLIATPYCNEADIVRYLSTQGVTAFSDHDESGDRDTGVVDDCINQATGEIDFYVAGRYTAAQLATSNLINRWCTVLATFFLCERRGNPPPQSVQTEATRIWELLQKVHDGWPIAGLGGRAMSMSNLTVDRRYRRHTIRVTESNSTQGTSSLPRDTANDWVGY